MRKRQKQYFRSVWQTVLNQCSPSQTTLKHGKKCNSHMAGFTSGRCVKYSWTRQDLSAHEISSAGLCLSLHCLSLGCGIIIQGGVGVSRQVKFAVVNFAVGNFTEPPGLSLPTRVHSVYC